MAKSQRALDGATKRFNDFERADAKRTEESKAAKAKAKKLRTKRDKDAAALQVCSSAASAHVQSCWRQPLFPTAHLTATVRHTWHRARLHCMPCCRRA